jgi:Ca2+-binding RTX toxin-like protein
MRQRPSLSFRPALESLDGRLVPAILPPNLPNIFDPFVSVQIESSSSGYKYIVIDGSDYDDVIEVRSVNLNTHVVQLHIEQWSNGVKLTATTSGYSWGAGRLADFNPIAIQGRGGNDRIVNLTPVAMTAFAGSGNDVVIGGGGNDYINGEAGANTLSGGNGNDQLYGGELGDSIDGGDGEDIINGYDGDDRLYGSFGNDQISGGNGADTLYGGFQWDVLSGGAGGDILYGDNGDNNPLVDYADTLYGGGDNDFLRGDAGNDRMYGEGGHDNLVGGFGNDQLDGGVGNDFLAGGVGDDTLSGGDGRDSLYGQEGKDHLDGGYWSSESINEPDYLVGGGDADTFVRHTSVFFGDDPDVFADFDGADAVEIDRHWF